MNTHTYSCVDAAAGLIRIKAARALCAKLARGFGNRDFMFARTNKIHSYVTHAKKRIDQMDAAITTLERMVKKSSSPSDTPKLLANLRRRRDHLALTARQMKSHAKAAEARIKKLSAAGSVSWSAFRSALAKSRKVFARANRKAGKAFKRAVR